LREILYGRHAVREALRAGRRRFYRLRLSDAVRSAPVIDEILDHADQAGLPVERVQRRELDQLGDLNHQGVALESSGYPYVNVNDILGDANLRGAQPLVLVLDLINDPQNLGSLLRTADAVGAHGVIIQERRAAGVTPSVVRTSSGAVEYLMVARVTNIASTIERLRDHSVWAAGLDNTPGAQQYDQADLRGSLAVVVGSEGRGLRRLVRERCDFLLRLPMEGHLSSLNAAVAGSIVLYEVWRQRQARGAGQDD
jgi:23S rRNA (guanosine2251-2'-O)-methyltransferase